MLAMTITKDLLRFIPSGKVTWKLDKYEVSRAGNFTKQENIVS